MLPASWGRRSLHATTIENKAKVVIVTLYNVKTKYHRLDKEGPLQPSSSEMEVPRKSQAQVGKKKWKISALLYELISYGRRSSMG